ncbi:hypothetical protein DMB95_01135 [Campylobacter sp. MIT 12-8780]|nr:hypothetical protein DMB95_01135 [Campylobacter sp. MIT 12-8780]
MRTFTNPKWGEALINESLSYVDIEAEIAWDLNLALPKGYKFTYITFGSSGSEAMVKFFNYCKVKTLFHWTLDKDKFAYYYRVLQDKNNFCALTLCCINEGIWAKSKLPYLIDEKVPLLFVARDIIEMIRVIVNHTGQLHIDPLMKKFNLTCDYTKLFPKMNYAISNNEKPKIIIKNLVHRLAFQTKIKQWQHFIKEVICIDFNDIKPDKAFKTFKNLALKFGFESPKDEAIFKEKISVASSGRLATLPVVLYAHEDDLNNVFTKNAKNQSQNLQSFQKEDGISFIIGVYLQLKAKLQSGYIDISKEILDQKIIINDRELIVCIEKAEYEILKLNEKLMNASKAYIQGYIKALIENDKQIVSNLITCEQILEYLRENKAERKAVKQTLDQEYSYIKEHYSHFFKSWKYYNEFEKMCEELDKKD